jgi:O-acetyl-ADP-ribose deacetylase (regulator of RNase III)
MLAAKLLPRRNSTSSWSECHFQHWYSVPSQTSAGPELEHFCRRHSPIVLGDAVVTPGFELPNPFVIHARAASFINDDHPEKYLDLAVAQTLRVAKEAGIKSMAMPAIGTGVFKFPPELSAEIIINGLLSRSEDYPGIHLVRICVGTQEMKAVFASTLVAKISSPA